MKRKIPIHLKYLFIVWSNFFLYSQVLADTCFFVADRQHNEIKISIQNNISTLNNFEYCKLRILGYLNARNLQNFQQFNYYPGDKGQLFYRPRNGLTKTCNFEIKSNLTSDTDNQRFSEHYFNICSPSKRRCYEIYENSSYNRSTLAELLLFYFEELNETTEISCEVPILLS